MNKQDEILRREMKNEYDAGLFVFMFNARNHVILVHLNFPQ